MDRIFCVDGKTLEQALHVTSEGSLMVMAKGAESLKSILTQTEIVLDQKHKQKLYSQLLLWIWNAQLHEFCSLKFTPCYTGPKYDFHCSIDSF